MIMKKFFILAMAVLTLAACSNDSDEFASKVTNDKIDASNIQFNITVNNADGAQTRGVKTGWKNADEVYVFFEDNSTQYVKMTYDGSAWTYSDKDGGTSYTNLELTASGKKLSAVYVPSYVPATAPAYVTDKWTLGSVYGYFLKAEAVDYTVTVGDVTTLTATINMTAPDNLVQVFIPTAGIYSLASGNEYVLNMTNVRPFTFDGIAPGGAATVTTGTDKFPITGCGANISGDAGYYFWGILAETSLGEINYNFQLVQRNAEKKYAISSMSKTVANKELTGPTAIKLSDLSPNGNFVSLGYPGGPLWATGNLDKTHETIVDPLEAGEYFKYGETTPYSGDNTYYNGTENPLATAADVAYSVNTGWHIPTNAQFEALFNSSYTTYQQKHGWTNLGSDNDAYLYTSKANGISLLFAAAGYYQGGSLQNVGINAIYWTSTPNGSDYAYVASPSNMYSEPVGNLRRYFGSSVRPVKN